MTPYWPPLYQSWYDCWCSLGVWGCGSLVSPSPLSLMLLLCVYWWGSLLIFSLLDESSVLWGVYFSFFILAWSGFWLGCLYQIFVWLGFRLGYLPWIFVNDLPSHFLLLSPKIMLENSLFWLLPSNIKSLGTMTSRKYGRVDVDLGDTMASSKLH